MVILMRFLISALAMVFLLGTMTMQTDLVVGADESTKDEKSIYDFKVKTITGEEVSLEDYKGKTILIVNVASKCGYTRQYADMQAAFEKYKDRDFVVLGFPCNQFGGQEPGSEEEIIKFCKDNYGVSFPMFAKLDVKGDGADPLFKYLSGLETAPKAAGDISWNFEKFLINAEGKVIGRYKSAVSPTGKEMEDLLENLLPKTGKKVG
jgi:glutathione peroxidase